MRLAKDQTPNEVESILGPPTLKELQTSGTEFWNYGETRFVEFQAGKVVAFGDSNKRPMPSAINTTGQSLKSEDYSGPPKELGSSCSKDNDCQTRNCHLVRRVCAGPNNCTVALGKKMCAVDTDCCKGRCDFGTCRE